MAVSWHAEAGVIAGFSLLSFILCYIPLAWHFEAWNVGCVLYIFWIGTGCLFQFINYIVWFDNAVNVAPVWCDISIRFLFIARLGIVASGLIIARRLCKITTGTTTRGSRRDKMRSVSIDLAIGLGFPLAQLIIFWFIQGHRFDIYEGVGCRPAIPVTWVFMVLSACWPVALGLVSCYYSVRTLIAFTKRRREFSELLSSNSNLTYNRYFRLMALAVIEIVVTVPLGIWLLVSTPISYEYKGLADLHDGFSRVRQFPLKAWILIPGARQTFESDAWIFIALGLLFFINFGFAEEARRNYRKAYGSITKTLGISSVGTATETGFTATGSKMGSSGFGRVTIPTFIQRNASKRDSFGSFSDRLSAISIGDVGGFLEDEKTPYTPTESSAGSSTNLGSPVDEKQELKNESVQEIAKPESAYSVETVQRLSGPPSPTRSHHDLDIEAQRKPPSVELPSSVRNNSIDMV
ncbi:STE3-domain-containing protein [Cristinia sonorae]|uniref:STE3-domain-containing protein n=1 Tax=Cristinia sonorae TaxID=1940300 RepID=A0A8K0UIU7_9AGAR|nr:STE3-domain-containing protein [Cristinia sonorae]